MPPMLPPTPLTPPLTPLTPPLPAALMPLRPALPSWALSGIHGPGGTYGMNWSRNLVGPALTAPVNGRSAQTLSPNAKKAKQRGRERNISGPRHQVVMSLDETVSGLVSASRPRAGRPEG